MFNDILWIDIESTGQDPEKHSIIQLAAEYHRNGMISKHFNIRIKPKNEIYDINALKVNKFSPLDDLDTNFSYPQDKALGMFVDFLISLKTTNRLVIGGHKTAFDVRFLRKMFHENNVEGFDQFFSWDLIDTSFLAHVLKSKGKLNLERVSLSELANYFKIEFPQEKQHNAVWDVNTTAKVYYELLKLI